MTRRCCALLLAFLLAALPLLGLAAPAPACAQCPSAASVQETHCHQQAVHAEQCHHCAGCAACVYPPVFHAASPLMIGTDAPATPRIAYLPAHFYHIASSPPDRPPSLLPA